jgi:hypothetical protein
MKKLLLVPVLLIAACATTGGGSKGSNAPFQGADAVTKRRTEVTDAARAASDCVKVKKGDTSFKGGVFMATADASGKLTVEAMKWEGPDEAKQCILAAGNKATVTPLPGPSVSSTWEWMAEGQKQAAPVVPSDMETKVQSLQAEAGASVEACAQQNLPPDFPADIEVAFFVDAAGQVHGPTVVKSTSKDGGFDGCVQGVIAKTKFPQEKVDTAYPMTMHFHVGRLEKL